MKLELHQRRRRDGAAEKIGAWVRAGTGDGTLEPCHLVVADDGSEDGGDDATAAAAAAAPWREGPGERIAAAPSPTRRVALLLLRDAVRNAIERQQSGA